MNFFIITANVEQLTKFQLRLVGLDGSIIERPGDMARTGLTATGRLEVLYSGHWGTVCSNGFTDTSRQVACMQLGYIRQVILITNIIYLHSGFIFTCVSNAAMLPLCRKNNKLFNLILKI